jgi:hypothetical protein
MVFFGIALNMLLADTISFNLQYKVLIAVDTRSQQLFEQLIGWLNHAIHRIH